jgi:hypothetical protein
MATIKAQLAPMEKETSAIARTTYQRHGLTFSQPLPTLENIPSSLYPPGLAPAPYSWEPKFLPEQWVYTDGSDITVQPRLGASVIYIPTNTPIYIDATGIEKTRTILRAELVAMHMALAKLDPHEWIVIFIDSLSSLHAMRYHRTNPGRSGSKHYHNHLLLLGCIIDLLDTRRSNGYRTTLHKIRAHTKNKRQ